MTFANSPEAHFCRAFVGPDTLIGIDPGHPGGDRTAIVCVDAVGQISLQILEHTRHMADLKAAFHDLARTIARQIVKNAILRICLPRPTWRGQAMRKRRKLKHGQHPRRGIPEARP